MCDMPEIVEDYGVGWLGIMRDTGGSVTPSDFAMCSLGSSWRELRAHLGLNYPGTLHL